MAVPAYQKKPQWSWWGGLYKRLLARGIDAGTAKLVSRHIREDWKQFAEAYFEQPTEARFRQVFLGDALEIEGI